MQKSNNITLGLVIAIVIALGVGFFGSRLTTIPAAGSTVNGGNVTDYAAVNTTAGYWTNSTQIIGSSGILAASLAQFDAGVLRSYTNSTSTSATSATLVQADLGYDTVLATPNVAALTYTFPASSTITSLIPTAGDRMDQCWVNSTTTSAATITFAEGTGINLQVASSTTNIGFPSIQAGGTACFTFIRKGNSDINAVYTRYVDGN